MTVKALDIPLPRRGELWVIDFTNTGVQLDRKLMQGHERKLCLILQNNAMNLTSPDTILAFITDERMNDIKLYEQPLRKKQIEKLKNDSKICLQTLYTVKREWLQYKIYELSNMDMEEVDKKLKLVLGLK